jgi:hypothetical protein
MDSENFVGRSFGYLNQFETSPYVMPAKERQTVDGASTLRGSFRPSATQVAEAA